MKYSNLKNCCFSLTAESSQLVFGIPIGSGASEESGEWEELKSCRRSLEAKHSDHFHSLCRVGGQLLGCLVARQIMVPGFHGDGHWMSTKNKGPNFEDQTHESMQIQCQGILHRFVFLPQLISMQTTMMAASHRLFEPEMPKVFFYWELIGLFQFCTCFSPRVFFACF